jgi:hypothetical protein
LKYLEEIFGGQGIEEVMEVTRVIVSETKSFKDTFENENVTRDTESSFLVVAVLLSRLVEEFHEHWMVEKFS